MLRRVAVALLAVVMLVSLSGCAGKRSAGPSAPEAPAAEEPKYGGTFVIAQYADVTQLCPFLATDGASNTVSGIIHRPLVMYRGTGLVPMMAERWEVSSDNLVWTFYLRKGIKWHDGTEFTAEDVKYTYDLIMDPKTKSVRRSDFALVDKVEVVDPYTVRVITKEPFAPFLDKIATQPIVCKHHVEKIGLEKYNEAPLGTGPFKFKERVPEEKVVLERFDDYFEGKPYLDQLVFVNIPEPSVRLMALEKGEAHYNWWATPEEEIPRLEKDPKFTLYWALRTDFHFFGLNHWHPFFKDVRVRQAIAYAIDKEAIVKNLVPYTGVVAHGPYSEAYGRYYSPDVPKFSYNPAKAKELLAAAGWADSNNDGVLEKDGKPFKIELMIKQGDELRRNVGTLIQKWLKDVGIEMTIREREWSLMLDALTKTRDNWDVTLIQFGASPDPDHHTIFHSKGGFDLGNYSNPRVDELLEKGRTTIDPDQRKAIYDEYQKIVAEDVAVIFLWHSRHVNVCSSRFKGMTQEPFGQLQYIHRVWDTQAGK